MQGLLWFSASTQKARVRLRSSPSLRQKPQPDHQSAAAAAAAAVVRHEICFEGTVFTWCDGADARWSRDIKNVPDFLVEP